MGAQHVPHVVYDTLSYMPKPSAKGLRQGHDLKGHL